MFKSYTDIFNARGLAYHQAMMDFPQARAEEFKYAIRLANLQQNNVVCDVPSGGCYLEKFIQTPVKLISIETSAEFLRYSSQQSNNTSILCADVSHIPLTSGSIDRAISVAGVHHLPNKEAFYRDIYRVLKQDGIFCLADVCKGSKVDSFLNQFVDQHNSLGHRGNFLDIQTAEVLGAAGFKVTFMEAIAYHWKFASPEAMGNFCKLLFGLDKANIAQVVAGIQKYLGFEVLGDECLMNWELYFFKAVKVSPF